MKKEERLDLLKQIEKDIYVPSIESTLLDDAKSCAIHSAIEELEKEPVLNKIRAEIEQDAFKDVSGSKYIFVNRINQIIDKYRGESEK